MSILVSFLHQLSVEIYHYSKNKMIEPSNQYFQEKRYKRKIREVISSLIMASLVIMIIWFGLFLFSHLGLTSNLSKAQETLLDTIPGNNKGAQLKFLKPRDSLTFSLDIFNFYPCLY